MGVTLFSELIAQDWLLAQQKGYWAVEETASNTNNKLVMIGGCPAIAFSLDKKGVDPIPLIKQNTPKKGMRSVCDAMVVTNYGGKTYFCAMDLKSEKSGGATHQIETARRLFDWLIGLANHNNHWPSEDTENCFFGIVNLAPRNQVRKGVIRRSAEIPAPEISPFGGYKIFRLKNHSKVTLPLLIERL